MPRGKHTGSAKKHGDRHALGWTFVVSIQPVHLVSLAQCSNVHDETRSHDLFGTIEKEDANLRLWVWIAAKKLCRGPSVLQAGIVLTPLL